MRKGMFWYYFEEMPYTPPVTRESKYPCRGFDLNAKSHLVRVMYYNNKICIEMFHSLCDGKGAFKFFTALLTRYFTLLNIPISDSDGFLNYLDLPNREEVEDAFSRYADLNEAGPRKDKLAYQVRGTPLQRGKQHIYTGVANLGELKAAAKKYGATLTEYMLARILWPCNEQRKMLKETSRPIGVQLPIDLRKFFETETLRNFSTYKYMYLPAGFSGAFEDMIPLLRGEIAGIDKAYVMKNINTNVKPQKNIAVRLIPRFIKDIVLRLSSRLYGERLVTTTVSNVGQIDTPPEFAQAADFYECVLGISRYNKFSVTMCTFGSKTAISFTSKITEADIIASVFRAIAADGVRVELISNREAYDER
jgi:NRPS condensation-like uncharacterized protein